MNLITLGLSKPRVARLIQVNMPSPKVLLWTFSLAFAVGLLTVPVVNGVWLGFAAACILAYDRALGPEKIFISYWAGLVTWTAVLTLSIRFMMWYLARRYADTPIK